MNKEQRLFLKLVSSALSGETNVSSVDDFDVQILKDIAKANKCLSFIYQGLVNNSLPYSDYFKKYSAYTVLDSYKKLAIESEVIDILSKNSIRSCVLKGSSVALNYKNPLIRPKGDIDLLVDEHNFKKTSLLFISEEEFNLNKHSFHMGFYYKNVKVEIHKSITEPTIDPKLYSLLSNALDNTQIKNCDVYKIPVLTEPYQALSLLTHMIRHFRDNEFVFRMFCDWVCFVKSISDDEWFKSVYPMIKQAHLDKFADALNKTATIYLEAEDDLKGSGYVDETICLYMIEEFISVNKARTQNGTTDNLGTLLSRYRKEKKNIVSAYISVVNYIAKNKYALGKYKIMIPFFCIWLPLKYILNVIVGKRDRIDIKKMRKVIRQRKIIFETFEPGNK